MGTPVSVRTDGPLTVEIEQDRSSLVARVRGQLDIGTADTLDQELQRISYCDASVIMLDFGEVDFIDSIGLRVLLAAARRSRENGNRLRIRRGSAVLERLIHLSGLENRLPLVDR